MSAPTYTVVELTRRIANTLDDAFVDDVWVTGEISGLNRSRGHVYFDLVEPTDEPGRTPAALLAVALFKMNKDVVNRSLKRSGVVRMDNGVQVRIRGQVTFNERNGRLQVRMTGIDPAYTLGQIAIDRERVLRALRAEGLVDRNARLVLAPLPLRVGLVTSVGSAAYHDFVHELQNSGFAFRVRVFDTKVQGAGAGDQVVQALRQLSRLDLDVIALVRGGGSRADLATFDGEQLARTIATLHVPVLTGVGHEVDRSIADEVAHTAYKTPTACAAALVNAARLCHDGVETASDQLCYLAREVIREHDEAVRARAQSCAKSTRSSLRGAKSTTDNVATRVAREATHTLARATHRVDRRRDTAAGTALERLGAAQGSVHRAVSTVRTRAPRELGSADRQLDLTQARLRALDPTRLLARGWSITQRADGSIARSAHDLADDDLLITLMVDGVVHSRVQTVAPSPGGQSHGS